MTVIAYSDILKSLSSPHGNVSLILEDMKKRKEEYEEELKYKKVDIVFFWLQRRASKLNAFLF